MLREAGFDTAQRVILKLYDPILTGLTPEQMSKDPKTRLQELLQGDHLPRPEYAIVAATGAAHERRFECECRIERLKIVTRGTATSRREAEQAAAELALTAAKEALK